MPRIPSARLFVACLTLAAAGPTARADAPGDEKPYGLVRRVPWTTSRIRGTPDPPPPYRTEPAFPGLKFAEPLAMAHAPGSDRVFVAQRYGKVFSFPNDPKAGKAEPVFDLGRHLFGLALHPEFARNGFLFVSSLIEPAGNRPRTMRVSRLKIGPGDPPSADPRGERVLIEWPSLYHDGGCLAFGRDGCLYIAAGDGGGPDNGQGLGDLSSSILRIDVDHAEGDKPYAVPRDNPFVGVAGTRPEVWAYGLRQPWKFSFDRATGDLWAGDVGQDLWEMVYLVRRGGNYGWNLREGNHPFQPWRKSGPTPILPPVVEHGHAEARSITGGFVYRGTRLRELTGAYIYGDYDTGKVWALRYDRDGGRVVWHGEIADSSLRIVGFGEDAAGELYLVDHMGGGIHRLAPSPPAEGPSAFPRRLRDYPGMAAILGASP
jgi:glucose/arabinose dehydrogenase